MKKQLGHIWMYYFENAMQLKSIVENIKSIFDESIRIPIDDDINFELKNVSDIREGDDYNGYRVHLLGYYPPMSVPLKLDVTTGDKITPI